MNGTALPLVLLGLAIGIAFARVPSHSRLLAFVALSSTSVVVASLPLHAASRDVASLAVWIAVALCAATVHWPRPPTRRFVLALAVAGGACAGALAAAAAGRPEAYVLPPAAAMFLLAPWCVRHGALVAVKVLSSWIIAVTVLVATLQTLPVTLGDRPDHLE